MTLTLKNQDIFDSVSGLGFTNANIIAAWGKIKTALYQSASPDTRKAAPRNPLFPVAA